MLIGLYNTITRAYLGSFSCFSDCVGHHNVSYHEYARLQGTIQDGHRILDRDAPLRDSFFGCMSAGSTRKIDSSSYETALYESQNCRSHACTCTYTYL